jgi:hypothetical protein
MSKINDATNMVQSANQECRTLAKSLPKDYYVKLFVPLLLTNKHEIRIYKKRKGKVPWLGQGKLCAEISTLSITVFDEALWGMLTAYAKEYGYAKIIKEFEKNATEVKK